MAVRLTLDKVMNDRGISRYEAAKCTGIRYQIIDNYYKNKVIRYDSYILDKLCQYLECNISDLIEFSKENR